jgi:hypothetical protein
MAASLLGQHEQTKIRNNSTLKPARKIERIDEHVHDGIIGGKQMLPIGWGS